MRLLSLSLGLLWVSALQASEPCVSGLKVGQRPGPYSALVATGSNRGTQHCFICETSDRPAVVVFAHRLSDPLGKLAQGIDKALTTHKASELRAWITFLNEDQTAFDPQVVQWSKKQGLGNTPTAIFEDVLGPPSYRLNREADVTVLLFVKQKVVHNFAFREGELTDKKIDEILKAIPSLTKK